MDETLKLKAEQLAGDIAAQAQTLDDLNGLIRTLMKSALQRMLAARTPYVLDVVTPYTEHVLPFIPAGRTVADMIWKQEK